MKPVAARSNEALGLSDEEILAALDELACHTVILYGSRAKGTATGASDWDVLGVRESGEAVRVARSLPGGYLDAFVEPEQAIDAFDPGHLRFLGGRLLKDERGYGVRLLERLAELRDRGPTPLSREAARSRREWLERTLVRAAGGSAISDYRRAWLLFELLPAYFDLRGAWYLGPKESLAWMEEHAHDAHHLFSAALQPAAEPDDLARLVAFVVRVTVDPAAS